MSIAERESPKKSLSLPCPQRVVHLEGIVTLTKNSGFSAGSSAPMGLPKPLISRLRPMGVSRG